MPHPLRESKGVGSQFQVTRVHITVLSMRPLCGEKMAADSP